MKSPCECDIEPPGSISHGVSYLISYLVIHTRIYLWDPIVMQWKEWKKIVDLIKTHSELKNYQRMNISYLERQQISVELVLITRYHISGKIVVHFCSLNLAGKTQQSVHTNICILYSNSWQTIQTLSMSPTMFSVN